MRIALKRNLKNRNNLVSNFIDYGELARGTSISIPVFIKDEFDKPVDLSKYSIAFTVKTIQSDFDRNDSSAVIAKTLTPQVPLNGEFYIELSSYDLNIEPEDYFFDICLFNESGAVLRVVNGKFAILGGPTNRLVTPKFESLAYGNGIFIYLKMGTPIVCIAPTIGEQSSDLSDYITVNGTDISIKSVAGNGINISTEGVSLTNGYMLASLGQSAPEESSGNLLTDIGNIFSSLTAKQNKPTVVIPEGAVGNIMLSDNTECLLNGAAGASTAITLTLPAIDAAKGYNSYFVFSSGATPTTITLSALFDGTLKFKGDDCANGIFTPAANTVYEVALKCVGTDSNNKPYIVARVGAC